MDATKNAWKYVVVLFLFTTTIWAQSQSGPILKTAFIYQFTKYIEWPETFSLPEEDRPFFVISVWEDSPLLSELEKLSSEKDIKGKKIKLNVVKGPSEILEKKSHILVYGGGESPDLFKTLEQMKGTGTLLIGHGDGLGKKGMMINFYTDEGRLRFEINRKAIERENLYINSQLLKLSRIVE